MRAIQDILRELFPTPARRAYGWLLVAYVVLWAAFATFPEFKATLLSVPLLGPAVNGFTILFVAGTLIFVVLPWVLRQL